MIQLSTLAQHAIDNVWCNPGLDNQTILGPKRITPPVGARNNFTIMWDPYLLPTNGDIYHVFQIGGINPVVLGLFQTNVYTPSKAWINMMDVCNTQHTTINVYNDNGISIPLHSIYYNYTISGDLVIAIKENAGIPINWSTEQLYMRLYTNAYFVNNNVIPVKPNVFGSTLATSLDATIFVNTCATYTGNGKLFVYVNGYLTDTATMFNIFAGDTVEAVWDASVLKIIDIDVSTLTTFNSFLDSKSKYLLHYPNDGANAIEYWDDNDIYIVSKLNTLKSLGVFYHNNAIDATRMVTHRDYSIVVAYAQSHINVLKVNTNANVVIPDNKLSVRLIVRRPATFKPLSFNSSLINELYKLSDADIVRTMTGNVVGPAIWTASALESSGYTAMMRSSYQEYMKGIYSTSDIYVKQAYSHNNVAALMSNTPQIPTLVNNVLTVNVPSGLQSYSTVYEYDANGLYLGNYHIVAAAIYHPFNPTCAMVEILKGVGGLHNGYIDSNTSSILVTVNHNLLSPSRLMQHYVRQVDSLGNAISGWVPERYRNIDPTFQFNNIVPTQIAPGTELLIRTDGEFLCYDNVINLVNGVYSFILSEQITINGVPILVALVNPLLMLDIFLNQHSLIEGVDYVLVGNLVTIISTKWLINNGTGLQSIHVRYLGTDQDIEQCEVIGGIIDKGWVSYNMLSNNNKYDFTEGRVQRVVVDGRVVDKSTIVFSDNHSGVSLVNTPNGVPYQVTDLPINTAYFLKLGFPGTHMLSEFSVERLLYKDTANYMNSLLPQPPRAGLSVIPNKYNLYSPFISNLINDLIAAVIPVNSLMPNLTDNEIIAICQPYEHLLASDPIKLNLDPQYVLITPHPHSTVMQLSFFQYRFLNNVVRLYCNGLVSLSPSVVMV